MPEPIRVSILINADGTLVAKGNAPGIEIKATKSLREFSDKEKGIAAGLPYDATIVRPE